MCVLKSPSTSHPNTYRHHITLHAALPICDPSPSGPEAPPPAAATSGPRHAADTVFDPQTMAGARETLRTEQGGLTAYQNMADRLEYRARDGRDGYLWHGQGWYGGDIDPLWITHTGKGPVGSKPEGTGRARSEEQWSKKR